MSEENVLKSGEQNPGHFNNTILCALTIIKIQRFWDKSLMANQITPILLSLFSPLRHLIISKNKNKDFLGRHFDTIKKFKLNRK